MEKLLSTVYDINKLWMWRASANFGYEWAFRKLESTAAQLFRGVTVWPMFIVICTNYASVRRWKFSNWFLISLHWRKYFNSLGMQFGFCAGVKFARKYNKDKIFVIFGREFEFQIFLASDPSEMPIL